MKLATWIPQNKTANEHSSQTQKILRTCQNVVDDCENNAKRIKPVYDYKTDLKNFLAFKKINNKSHNNKNCISSDVKIST